ncbi:hypothetical protein [Embleya sp. NBC_00896]|uniref:hypothetical protein n=1 Tax=Embleya sp. NBC_00896 TaxID=2975961 RepID=UPI002F90C370|nr:hypothetical protein OG928_47620 [Embleya sp. NBC_00896]
MGRPVIRGSTPAAARSLRSGADKNRVSLWERTTVPSDESQDLPAEVFDVPSDVVRAMDRPDWLPGRSTPIPSVRTAPCPPSERR